MAAVATLTTQQVVGVTGLLPTFTAAAGGGDQFVPGDTTWIVVKNGGGSPITVTIDSKVPSNYGVDQDYGGAVANGTERWFTGGPAQRLAGVSGLGDITYSGVTSVTVGVFSR